jgi:hypothetical protein
MEASITGGIIAFFGCVTLINDAKGIETAFSKKLRDENGFSFSNLAKRIVAVAHVIFDVAILVGVGTMLTGVVTLNPAVVLAGQALLLSAFALRLLSFVIDKTVLAGKNLVSFGQEIYEKVSDGIVKFSNTLDSQLKSATSAS